MASLREIWSERTGRPKEEFTKATKGMSDREAWAFATGKSKSEYPGGSKDSKSSSKSVSDMVKDITKSILDVTPGFQAPVKDFEEIYTPELQAEDDAQSRALFEPWYNEQISGLLEDLSSVEQMESVNYQRTLRRARFTMGKQGGAIGTEREGNDAEITQDYKYGSDNRLRQAEREVGTSALTGAGFGPVSQSSQEGRLVREMKQNIADQSLWYKHQRANRYYADAGVVYQQPSSTSLSGKPL